MAPLRACASVFVPRGTATPPPEVMEVASSRSLTDLPPEVVTLIFGLLGPVPRDILSIALVSKAVGKMLRGAAVHLDLTTSSAAPPSCADALSRQQHALRSVQQTLPGVAHLTLTNMPVACPDVQAMLPTLTALKVLDLSGCRKLAADSIIPALVLTSQQTSIAPASDAAHKQHFIQQPDQQPAQQSSVARHVTNAPAYYSSGPICDNMTPAAAVHDGPRSHITALNLQRCFQLNSGTLTQLLAVAAAAVQPQRGCAVQLQCAALQHMGCVAMSHLDLSSWPLDPQDPIFSVRSAAASATALLPPAQHEIATAAFQSWVSPDSRGGSGLGECASGLTLPEALASLCAASLLGISSLANNIHCVEPVAIKVDRDMLAATWVGDDRDAGEDRQVLSHTASVMDTVGGLLPFTEGSLSTPVAAAGHPSLLAFQPQPRLLQPTFLTILALHNCTRLTPTGMASIPVLCPHLQYLLLGGLTLSLPPITLPAATPEPLLLPTVAEVAGAAELAELQHPAAAAEIAVNPPLTAASQLVRHSSSSIQLLQTVRAIVDAAPPLPRCASVSAVSAARVREAAAQLAALAMGLPCLVALELTFSPPQVTGLVRGVLETLNSESGTAQAVQVWDFTQHASMTAAITALQASGACNNLHNSLSLAETRASNTLDGLQSGHHSAQPPHLSTSSLALALRAAVNCSSAARSTPLHFASERGDTHAARLLLTLGAQVDVRDAGGSTPLFVAAEGGHAAATATLLSSGSDPRLCNSAGESPLYIAALKGHLPVVVALLAHFQATDIPWTAPQLYGDSWTPLMAAAVSDRTDVAAALLSAAGPAAGPTLLRAVNKYGQSALHIAARKGSQRLLRVLLGATGGSTKALLAADSNGQSPVDVAKRYRHEVALAEFRHAVAGLA